MHTQDQPPERSKLLATLFKAASEPVRVRLIALLATEGELCVCELIDALDLPQSLISRHLAHLRHAGLVSARRQGIWMYYSIADNISDQGNGLIELIATSAGIGSDLADDRAKLQQQAACA